jgi:hypothetical protein
MNKFSLGLDMSLDIPILFHRIFFSPLVLGMKHRVLCRLSKLYTTDPDPSPFHRILRQVFVHWVIKIQEALDFDKSRKACRIEESPAALLH